MISIRLSGKGVLTFMALLAFGHLTAQTPSQRGAVQVSAVAQNTPVAINLVWPVHTGANTYTIYRRPAGQTTWGASIGTAGGTSTGFSDFGVVPNTAYEYKVRRTGNGTGYGYVRSGIEVPATDMHYRGKMIVVVESGVGATLVNELAQLEEDLLGDGWFPIRIDVNASDSPPAVRSLIVAQYNADPTNVKAVYLIGHVPVPYSGNSRPDGHVEHRGAWACDGYYGEMNSTWTDNSVNSTGALTPWTHNVPGDGKFDQTYFPSDVELMVGRLHLGQLPAFPQSETQLMADYLNKAHAFKMRWWEHPATAVIHDNLSWVNNPLASGGYSSIAAMVGAAGINDVNPNAQAWSTFSSTPQLVNYHSGSGTQSTHQNSTTFIGINGGGTTNQLVNTPNGSVFNISFGSYFGDWDNYNNYLRAVLANGDGLVSVWSGQPNWFLHPLAMGEPAGYTAKLAMNNSSSNYNLQNGGWWGNNYSSTHLGLMGDPSIRMRMVAPPSQLVATNNSWYIDLNWTASPDVVLGYYVYRVDSANGEIELISPLVTTTNYTSSTQQFFPGDQYMVRAAAMQITASGSFENLSLAAHAVAAGMQIPDCNGVVGGTDIPNTPCDDGDSQTGNDTWGANCVCTGQPLDCEGVAGGNALPGTTCDDGDSGTGNDQWDANCNCVGVPIDCLGVIGGPALPGTPCDDNDNGTGNDTWTGACICEGEVIDCEGIIGGSALPGTACDDADSTTVNDTWTSACNCEGVPVGIDEQQGLQYKVFPNPSNGVFTISLERSFSGTLEIVDMNGKLSYRKTLAGSELQVDMKSSTHGAYLMRLIDKSGKVLSEERIWLI